MKSIGDFIDLVFTGFSENCRKRRSEEPLVKLKVVPERSLEPCSEVKEKPDFEKEKNGETNKEKQSDKISIEENDEENGGKEDIEEEEEDFEVESIVDYTYDKKTVRVLLLSFNFREGILLSYPKFTANRYCICLSTPEIYA